MLAAPLLLLRAFPITEQRSFASGLAFGSARHFGVDAFTTGKVVTIGELHAGAQGINSVKWNNVAPDPAGPYSDPAPLIANCNEIRQYVGKVQLNFLPYHDAAMDVCADGTPVTITSSSAADDKILTASPHGLSDGDWVVIVGHVSTPDINGLQTVVSHDATHFAIGVNITTDGTGGTVRKPTHTFPEPGTGDPHPRWLSIKTAHTGHWEEVFAYLADTIPVDYVQIGTEPWAQWEQTTAGAQGIAEAVRLACDAIKSVRPSILVMTPAFNFGNRFLNPASPETGQQPFFRDFLTAAQGKFDILSLHLSHLPEGFAPTLAWVKSAMADAGVGSKPVWAEDMASGPMYELPYSSQADVDFQALVEDEADPGHAAAVAEYRIRQARSAVIKPVSGFRAGIGRIFLTWDVEKPTYLPELIFRYMGLLTAGGARKQAFYAYRQLVAEIDGWSSVDTVGTLAYRFRFSDGRPQKVVAWTDGSPTTIDLSGTFGPTVRVKTPVTTLDGSNNPVFVADQTGVSSAAVPVSTTPVFVEAELAPSAIDALQKTTWKPSAAALSLAGAPTRLTAHGGVAGLSFSGAAGRLTGKAQASALSFSGSVNRLTQRGVAAIASFAGGLSRGTQRAMASGLSFAGAHAASTLLKKALTAALSFAGAATRTVGKAQAGTLSFGTAAEKSTGHGFNGALSFLGTASKRTARGTAGALSLAGATNRAVSRSLAAVLAISGALSRVVRWARTGALSFAGAWSGFIVAAGHLYTLALAATLAFGGGLGKRTDRGLAAVLGLFGDFLGWIRSQERTSHARPENRTAAFFDEPRNAAVRSDNRTAAVPDEDRVYAVPPPRDRTP
jgi:hypothetical protein